MRDPSCPMRQRALIEQASCHVRSIRLSFFIAVEGSRGIKWETKQSSCPPPRTSTTSARCGEVMVLEHYMDLQDDTGQIGMTALRCTSCGEVIDPVILQNRVRSGPESLVRYEAAQSRWKATVARDMATDQAAVSLCGL